MSGDGFSPARVQEALAGRLTIEELTDQEAMAFFAGLADSMLAPTDAERAFYAGLGEGAPGVDEAALYGSPPYLSERPPTQRMAAGPIDAVINTAVEIWESPARAAAWLRHPHPLLDKKPPLLAAATEEGARRVMDLLDRLQRGTAS